MPGDESMNQLMAFLSSGTPGGARGTAFVVAAPAGLGTAFADGDSTLVEEEGAEEDGDAGNNAATATDDEDAKSGTDYSFDFSSSAAVEKDEFIERLGVLMSVFFQNAKGQNVVDAIHENSKVINELVKRLDATLAKTAAP
jgi:hypothetical protein